VFGMGTGVSPPPLPPKYHILFGVAPSKLHRGYLATFWSSPRPISIGQLNALLHLHLRPIYQMFSLGSYSFNRMGNFILRGASHLDAFSAYPVQTWLLSCAPGGTTDTPEVCPPRSSRTKGSSLHVSYARDR
jgi:hypothetical protein